MNKEYEFTEEDKAMFRDTEFEQFKKAPVKHDGRFIVWDIQYAPFPAAIKCPECGGMAVLADDSSDYVCVNPVCDFKYYDECDHPDDFIFQSEVKDGGK